MFIMTDRKELAEAGDKWLADRVEDYAKQAERFAEDAAAYAKGVQAVQAEIARRKKKEEKADV